MDENERASRIEEADRDIALKQHAERQLREPREDCADCGSQLAQHRKEYGTCIECQTARETRARQYRRD